MHSFAWEFPAISSYVGYHSKSQDSYSIIPYNIPLIAGFVNHISSSHFQIFYYFTCADCANQFLLIIVFTGCKFPAFSYYDKQKLHEIYHLPGRCLYRSFYTAQESSVSISWSQLPPCSPCAGFRCDCSRFSTILMAGFYWFSYCSRLFDLVRHTDHL